MAAAEEHVFVDEPLDHVFVDEPLDHDDRREDHLIMIPDYDVIHEPLERRRSSEGHDEAALGARRYNEAALGARRYEDRANTSPHTDLRSYRSSCPVPATKTSDTDITDAWTNLASSTPPPQLLTAPTDSLEDTVSRCVQVPFH